MDELLSCRFGRTEPQPEPRVGTGVKVVTGTGVPLGHGAGHVSPPGAANWTEGVVGVEAGAAGRVLFVTGSRNGDAGMDVDATGNGNGFGAADETLVERGGKDGQDVPERSRSGVPPWSVQLRSKDKRYRSSHRLVLLYIVPCMKSYGLCVVDNFLGSRTGDRALREVQELHRTGKMQDGKLASLGLGDTRSIRGDQIVWVGGKEPGCQNIGYVLSKMDRVVSYADGRLGKHKIRGRHSKVRTGTPRSLLSPWGGSAHCRQTRDVTGSPPAEVV